MSNQNILSEYLVRLGFDPDRAGLARFGAALREAAGMVDNEYLIMAKKIVESQMIITGAFAAIGAATLGYIDHVASADQEYRLFALRMMTSLPVARELKVSLDALGVSLEQVMWDPELAARFHQLVADQQIMTEQLGPRFEENMRRARDLRFEFTRLGVELKYLGMNVVNDLVGGNLDNIIEKFQAFNEAFISAIPALGRLISTDLKPYLSDLYEIFTGTGKLVGQLATDFMHFIGLLGDDSLVNAPLTFQNMAKAIQDVADTAAHAVEGLLKIETNLALLFDAGMQAASGNLPAALADLRKMAPVGVGPSSAANTPMQGVGSSPQALRASIVAQAKAWGIPADFALAIAAQESGGGDVKAIRQFGPNGQVLKSDKDAFGVMQVRRINAAGGLDLNDAGQNIFAGLQVLKEGLKLAHGDEIAAARYYYSGRPNSKDAEVNRYAQRVKRIETGISGGAMPQPVFHTEIKVQASSAQDATQIATAVDKAWRESREKDFQQIMNNLNEFSGWAHP